MINVSDQRWFYHIYMLATLLITYTNHGTTHNAGANVDKLYITLIVLRIKDEDTHKQEHDSI